MKPLRGTTLPRSRGCPSWWLRLPVGWRASTFTRTAEAEGILLRSSQNEYALVDGHAPEAPVLHRAAGSVGEARFSAAITRLARLLDNPPEPAGMSAEDWSNGSQPHYIAGAWRTPLSEVMCPTRAAGPRSSLPDGPIWSAPGEPWWRRRNGARAGGGPTDGTGLAGLRKRGQRPAVRSCCPVRAAAPDTRALGVLQAGGPVVGAGQTADPEPAFRFLAACHAARLPAGVIRASIRAGP
ncbi:MAG: hypothetical protein R3D53_09855 [Paracoccaceae bacterium]